VPAKFGQSADLIGGYVDGAHVCEAWLSVLHREPADRIGERDKVASGQRAIGLGGVERRALATVWICLDAQVEMSHRRLPARASKRAAE
jgi:hypothetical protein